MVVVAMPVTPGAVNLPGAAAEARKQFHDRARILVGPDATRDAVLRALPAARRAHFACHGLVDPASPSASRLLLNDYLRQPLTVTDVARLRLADADLAFLSACSTARPGEQLTDEAIHLASAFQLAGYRHVIGTLWPISDLTARNFASDVYVALVSLKTADTAAIALHAAIRQLRDQRPDRPSAWASHVHSGS